MAAPRRSSSEHDAVALALTQSRAALERWVASRFPAASAADVVQRGAIRALERADELRDPSRADAWVRRVVMTSALDELRAGGREIATDELPDQVADAPEATCACSLSQLASLPSSYADVLRRADVEGATLDELAASLGISKGNAAVRLHRARRALRDQLRDHCGVSSARECLSCACTERGCCST